MEESKKMLALSAGSIRRLLTAANEENILKEDIVSLVKEGEEFVLIYYGKVGL